MNESESDLYKLINGIGAIGEMAGVMMTSFTSNGMTRDEAYDLTKALTIEFIKKATKSDND